MTIKVGDKIPNVTLRVMGQDGKPATLTTEELFKGKRVVLFALPGAFTPTCSRAHLPGFVVHADTIKRKNVDTIVITSYSIHYTKLYDSSCGRARPRPRVR